MTDRLTAALAAAKQRYVDEHPRSAALHDRAAIVLPGGNTRSVLHIDPFAFRVAGADGARLHDVDGHSYLDLLGDYSAGLLGRSAGVAAAIREVLDGGWSYGAMSEPEVSLAEAIVQRFPSIDQVRFTNSGTEANLMALLTARHSTGRPRIVVFEGGYHGGPLYFGPGGEPLQAPFELAVLPYNDIAAVTAEFTSSGAQIAAALVEPMLGAGGCIPASVEFLGALRELTATNETVLIFDEVMTSRLSVGGAQELLGIVPDMTTLGKYFAGGVSFGAFGGARDLMSLFDPSGGGLTHGGTFNNNAFTMAAGAIVTERLTADVLDAVNGRGDRLRTALNGRFSRSPLPFQATGRGSLINVHPRRGPITSSADLDAVDNRWRELFFHDLLHDGFYFAPRGYIALTLDVTDSDVEEFVGSVEAFLSRHGG